MPRYNLAYFPSDTVFAETCVAFAAMHFGADADGYCLNTSNALPHVTLSQFRADESELDSIWKQATSFGTQSCDILFDCVDIRPGSDVHAGYAWAELIVRREPGLIACQQKIAHMLSGADIKPLTQSGDRYFPHLTFARLKKVPKAGTPAWPDKAGLKRPHKFYLTLGLSDDNGVYQRIILPKQI